ncbi:MocR-like pyridoxine biosynthesis transcription factor PdxR [Corallococcus silvisoli]|uniref:MocR-like pyridoxine biosynthesis transcription factor PdxR n=1 Tax=Corallococcus silvisoli TaxID=2697031 RepID=UPI0013768672|nr:PLP-dependent aminotransferase family protein [Corallococcus silvisoli]NBD10420.1 aminotransferase class I/II-fold pyridoxal phosphate-dependent enzyme [Corallococcus silvisoli]
MARWTLTVPLDARSPTPRFVQIARALAEDVRRGRLRPGEPLPGSRALAVSLGVHRNTVLAAYQELEAQGWIITTPGLGTFVARAPPDGADATPSARASRELGFALPPAVEARAVPRRAGPAGGALMLVSGGPDVRLLPSDLLARAYRRALKRGGQKLLDYDAPLGHAGLREALAAMLASLRGMAVTPDTLIITRGSQGALDLAARTLLRPGDTVAVESPGYLPAWDAFRLTGANVVPVPVDAEGLRVDVLERLGPVRAVYLTPHHQYPTTVTLSAERRQRLLAWARASNVALIEDDYDHEFHFEGPPVLPLASEDRDGLVLYVGTLSKVLAPGLRLGFLSAPAPFIARASAVRAAVDRQGDLVTEAAVAELLEEGEVQRHVRKMRAVYRSRRDVLVDALRASLGSALDFTVPAGGMTLWARCAPGVDAAAWVERGLEEGVGFLHGGHYTFDREPLDALRLCFTPLQEDELREAVRRMARALTAVA